MTTLAPLRTAIDSLATADGRFRVACARTGVSPVPVDGRRFPDRETATDAARLTRTYRQALRRWDDGAPEYALVVHEAAPGGTSAATRSDEPGVPPVWRVASAGPQRPSNGEVPR